MNIKRSGFQLLMGSAVVGLFLANCTVKEDSSDTCDKGDIDTGCDCPGNTTGYQKCNSDGVFGACICPDSGDNTAGKSASGGDSSTGGTTSGGTTSGGTTSGGTANTAGTTTGVDGGAGGMGAMGGEGGAPIDFDPNDCEACLAVVCPAELDACLDDTQCFDGEGTGEYERISDCITKQRVSGLVKRDVVRACGVSIGSSPSGNLNDLWAPQGMAASTTNLLNCLASSEAAGSDAKWANDPANYPGGVPTPWPEDSCAKISCTDKLE